MKAAGMSRATGLSENEPPVSILDPEERLRRTYEALMREVEIRHIVPVARGGEDAVNNVLPLLRSVHWAFDNGLFTIRPNREIIFRDDAPAELIWLFSGNRQAHFPLSPMTWPKAGNLDFHYHDVFGKVGL